MARRKKNKHISTVDSGPQEYGGWKVGDTAWFPSRYEATPRQGTIKQFYPKDRIAPCASVYDLTAGGQRVIPVQYLFEDKKKAKSKRQEYIDFLADSVSNSREKK